MLIKGHRILADINNDGTSDILAYQGSNIFVTNTDFALTPIMEVALDRPIKRVITGDFADAGYDQVCAVTDTNEFECYGLSTDRTTLWWGFTQGTFVGDDDDAIVGDLDGDGRDDILVYNRTSGAMNLYSMKSSFFFNPTPGFTLGNLASSAVPGMQLRVGDFNGDGRDDILVVNPGGQILAYYSAFDGTNNTLWWGWTTVGGFVPPGDQVSVARIDDNLTDDLVLRDPTTGQTSFYLMEYNGGSPPPITNVNIGQLDVTDANSYVYWGFMHGALSEPGANTRDDALVVLPGPAGLVRSDARFDGTNLTYWWAYTLYQDPLPVDLLPQQQDEWCWAASGQMIMNYLGASVSQCDEANQLGGRSDCCNSPTPAACDFPGWPQFANYGFSSASVNDALSWNDLWTQFDSHRSPVAFSWDWTGGGAHMMVAIGCKVVAGQQYVTINNPLAVNWGGQYDIPYSVYVSAPDHAHGTDIYNITRN
jgi:hypothetical protein